MKKQSTMKRVRVVFALWSDIVADFLQAIFIRSRRGPTTVTVIFLLLATSYRINDPPFIEQLRLRSFDNYVRAWPHEGITSRPIAILDIDERSLDELGQWPWPRTVVGSLLKSLRSYDIAVLAMDVVFSEEDRTSPKNLVRHVLYDIDPITRDRLMRLPDNELAMTRIMGDGLPVVLGMPNSSRTDDIKDRLPPSSFKGTFGPDPLQFIRINRFVNLLPNVETLNEHAEGFGVFSFGFDYDGTVRRVPVVVSVDEQTYPSLALETLRVGLQSQGLYLRSAENLGIISVLLQNNDGSRRAIPTDSEGRIWVKFGPPQPYNIAYEPGQEKRLYVSAIDVLERKIPKEWLQGHFVFLGTSASGLKDLRNTPVDPSLPGVEVHANVLSNILSGDSLLVPPSISIVETAVMLLAGILIIIVKRRFSLLPSFLFLLSVVAANFLVSVYLYQARGILYDALLISLVSFLIFIMFTLFNYLRESSEKKNIRRAFVQYLSPDLVDQLSASPDKLSLGGELRTMSFLFCDVRGFTTISESYKTNPQGLTHLMNRLLTPLTNEILERKGTIDKYMGDCIMAFWNAPLTDERHAANAVDSGLEMFRALKVLNAEREREAGQSKQQYLPLNIGIGINTGEAVVGNMGSEQRFDYSVLGDPVNLASRLEGQSKSYGVDMVIGENTAAMLQERYAVVELDSIAVKGKVEAVTIYTVLGDEDYERGDELAEILPKHREFLKNYRGQQWDKADSAAKACARFAPLTDFYAVYQERIMEHRASPPNKNWDGVYRATSK